MLLPAVCDNCGAFFIPPAINADNVRELTIHNVRVRPCPRCGGVGHIPDGVYNVLGNVLEVLEAPGRSLDELRRLSEILRRAKERKDDPAAVKERIRKESPGLSRFADLVPSDRSDLIAFISMAIAAASLIVQLSQSGEKAANVTVNQVVNNITVEASRAPSKPKLTEPPRSKRKATAASRFKKEKRRLKKSERQRTRKK